MNINYKLMDQNMRTYNGFQWKLGESREATGVGDEMCTDGVLHYYKHPVLALLFNPIHAGITKPRLFEIECSEEIAFDGLKGGCKRQKPIRELSIPNITTEHKVEFAIRVAMRVYPSQEFNNWANKWLKGEDRSEAAAEAAARAAWAAARVAAEAAAWAAARAAWAAAEAAWAAARVAVEEAAEAAEEAARAATEAARAADNAHELFISVLKEMNLYSLEDIYEKDGI